MKPALGWTTLSREEIRQVESSLDDNDQDTRDEIGFLLVHQGFADRFFPGTSVLHTRVRYALFVPWLFLQATTGNRRGSDLDTTVRRLMIQLAIRLKQLGGEKINVIGGEKLGQLTSQPPDRVYWTALRSWGLLLPKVELRSDALRRLSRLASDAPADDDGAALEPESAEAFVSLATPPKNWKDLQTALHFRLPHNEKEFLRQKLSAVLRPAALEFASSGQPLSLLARLVKQDLAFHSKSLQLPPTIDRYADLEDKSALQVARDVAALAAIGRAVYGALVEKLVADDGGSDDKKFRTQLKDHFSLYGEAASRCDIDQLKKLLPEMQAKKYILDVLYDTRAFVKAGNPRSFFKLRDCYETAEKIRKSRRRARLLPEAVERRAEWKPQRHNTTPLHYRWRVVRDMLTDLNRAS